MTDGVTEYDRMMRDGNFKTYLPEPKETTVPKFQLGCRYCGLITTKTKRAAVEEGWFAICISIVTNPKFTHLGSCPDCLDKTGRERSAHLNEKRDKRGRYIAKENRGH